MAEKVEILNVEVLPEKVASQTTPKLIEGIVPEEYGVSLQVALGIQSAFQLKIDEYNAFHEAYLQLINSEITEELSAQAKAMRNKLVKVRTGVDKIHKFEKSYYKQVGDLCDTLKNKVQANGIDMESNLKDIEDHQENINKTLKATLQLEREKELSKYVEDVVGRDLASMEDDVWAGFLLLKKTEFEQREIQELVAREAEVAAEKKAALQLARVEEIQPYFAFYVKDENKSLSDLSKNDFSKLMDDLKKQKVDYDAKQKAIEVENQTLLKRIQEQEDAEAKKQEQAQALALKVTTLRRERDEGLGNFKTFARYEGDIAELTEEEFSNVLKSARETHKINQLQQAEATRLREAENKRLEGVKAEADAKAKLAAESESVQIKAWIDSFTLPESTLNNDVTKDIKEKFEGFKAWASGLI